jgi:EAL domain-containing protein (putative c-di-GMP-specific phosphodiesterase class I)
MEGKLKKEELLKVIEQMEVIEKLPRQLLEELCRVFKVEEANAPQSHLIQQFKNKMVDIFIQEA